MNVFTRIPAPIFLNIIEKHQPTFFLKNNFFVLHAFQCCRLGSELFVFCIWENHYTLVHKDFNCCKFKEKNRIIPYSQKHYFDYFFFFNIWQPMLTYVIMYGLIVCRINIYCICIFMLCTTGILRYGIWTQLFFTMLQNSVLLTTIFLIFIICCCVC